MKLPTAKTLESRSPIEPSICPNQNGGNTDQASPGATGNAKGAEAAARHTGKGSGTTRQVPAEFREALAREGKFCLFGTSIAAMWLFGELDGRVDFFADEDSTRVGRECFGRPVVSPQQVPGGSRFWLELPTRIAELVKARLAPQCSNLEFLVPPELA